MVSRLTCIAVLVSLSGAPSAQTDATGEAAIRRIVAEQAKAWDAGDGPGYARHVAPDVSFTNLFGMVMSS